MENRLGSLFCSRGDVDLTHYDDTGSAPTRHETLTASARMNANCGLHRTPNARGLKNRRLIDEIRT
ncbi:hypothetical protein ACIPF8_22430 [Collimonas sp. NPDC087041]|uniref:hypothetical protein n=1 Tax=Collimonas sp. NPDC087041 TaxID=3363960 RepID=UPI0037F1CF5C